MAKEKIDAERKKQEFDLVSKILGALARRADEIKQANPSEKDFWLEPTERQKLMQMNNLGMVEGVAAGVVSLVFLRRIRASLLRRMWVHQQGGGPRPGQHAPPPPPPSATPNNPFHNTSPFQQHASQFGPPPPTPPLPPPSGMPKQGTFRYLFGWMMDILGAGSATIMVSFLLTDVNKILDKLATIPLSEGRSTISREFCPDVVREVLQVRQQDPAAAAVLDDAKTKPLQQVLQFTQNCQRRAAYEEQLRRNMGVARHYPVSVPPPGVPPDFPIDNSSTDDLGMDSSSPTTQDGNDFDFYDPRQEEGSEEWADNFTDDQGKS